MVDWIADLLGIQKVQPDGYSKTLNYCRLFMAVKGFLIGIPVGGLPLAISWPIGYDVGDRTGNDALREWFSCAGAGVSIVIFLIIIG